MTSTITLEEIADRLAIRELIDAYAHCADRRDASGQMALFTEKTAFHVYMDSRSPAPTYVLPITAECRWIFLFLFQWLISNSGAMSATFGLVGITPTRWCPAALR